MKYQGSCHCGKVRFEVEGEIDGAVSCNCSICRRRGSLLWFVPRGNLRLLAPEENAATYTFNKHVIKHRFCSLCGIHPYGEGTDPSGNRMAAINIRCLEGIDLDAVPVRQFRRKIDVKSALSNTGRSYLSFAPRFRPFLPSGPHPPWNSPTVLPCL